MIVLDASAAVEMTRETETGIALQNLIDESDTLIACDLFRAEVRNSYWKYVKANMLSREFAVKRINLAIDYIDEFVSIEELGDEAFSEAIRLRHSVYDMLYFCLARRHNATLVTLDKRLASLCEEADVNCISMVNLAA